MKNILAFAGSNSTSSINKELALYAASLVKEIEVNELDLNDFELPMYGMDYEIAHGIPENAIKFLELIRQSDGIIISLAEHNGAYAAVFKNLFDWLSRAEQKNFLGKPMLLMAASPGGRGGLSVLEMAADRFPRHDANIVAQFSFPNFGANFSDGKITNEDLNNQLLDAVNNFNNSL